MIESPNYLTIGVTLMVSQVLLGVAVGWWMMERRAKAKETNDKDRDLTNKSLRGVQSVATTVALDVDHHACQIEQISQELKNLDAFADEDTTGEVADMIDQIVATNIQLQSRLANSEQRLVSHAEEIGARPPQVSADSLDAVTQLPHRHGFDQELSRQFAEWTKHWIPLSVLVVGVDQLAECREQHGSVTGDAVLRHIAAALSKALASVGFVARYADDQFGIILPGLDLEAAKRVAERVRSAVTSSAFEVAPATLRATVSVGVTSALAEDLQISLLRRADSAWHAAIEHGRNRSYFYEHGKCLPVVSVRIISDRKKEERPATERPRRELASDELKRDRRGRRRAPFHGKSLVAPYYDGQAPAPDSFFEVECHDISANGISFLLPEPPTSSKFVMTLGAGEVATHMIVQVARTAKIDIEGTPMLLIGCCFAGRHEPSAQEEPIGAA